MPHGGQVLAGGAEHHRVERDVQGLLEALAGEPVAGGVLRIVLVDLEGDLASASGDGAFRAVPGSATDPGTRFTPLLHELEGPRLTLVADVEGPQGDARREDPQQAEIQGQLRAADGASRNDDVEGVRLRALVERPLAGLGESNDRLVLLRVTVEGQVRPAAEIADRAAPTVTTRHRHSALAVRRATRQLVAAVFFTDSGNSFYPLSLSCGQVSTGSACVALDRCP